MQHVAQQQHSMMDDPTRLLSNAPPPPTPTAPDYLFDPTREFLISTPPFPPLQTLQELDILHGFLQPVLRLFSRRQALELGAATQPFKVLSIEQDVDNPGRTRAVPHIVNVHPQLLDDDFAAQLMKNAFSILAAPRSFYDEQVFRALLTWIYMDFSYCYIPTMLDLQCIVVILKNLTLPRLNQALNLLSDAFPNTSLPGGGDPFYDRGFRIKPSLLLTSYLPIFFQVSEVRYRDNTFIRQGLHVWKSGHAFVKIVPPKKWRQPGITGTASADWSAWCYNVQGGEMVLGGRCQMKWSGTRYVLLAPSVGPESAATSCFCFLKLARKLTANAAGDNGMSLENPLNRRASISMPAGLSNSEQKLFKATRKRKQEIFQLKMLYKLGMEELVQIWRLKSSKPWNIVPPGFENETLIELEGTKEQLLGFMMHVQLKGISHRPKPNDPLQKILTLLTINEPIRATFLSLMASSVVIGFNVENNVVKMGASFDQMVEIMDRLQRTETGRWRFQERHRTIAEFTFDPLPPQLS